MSAKETYPLGFHPQFTPHRDITHHVSRHATHLSRLLSTTPTEKTCIFPPIKGAPQPTQDFRHRVTHKEMKRLIAKDTLPPSQFELYTTCWSEADHHPILKDHIHKPELQTALHDILLEHIPKLESGPYTPTQFKTRMETLFKDHIIPTLQIKFHAHITGMHINLPSEPFEFTAKKPNVPKLFFLAPQNPMEKHFNTLLMELRDAYLPPLHLTQVETLHQAILERDIPAIKGACKALKINLLQGSIATCPRAKAISLIQTSCPKPKSYVASTHTLTKHHHTVQPKFFLAASGTQETTFNTLFNTIRFEHVSEQNLIHFNGLYTAIETKDNATIQDLCHTLKEAWCVQPQIVTLLDTIEQASYAPFNYNDLSFAAPTKIQAIFNSFLYQHHQTAFPLKDIQDLLLLRKAFETGEQTHYQEAITHITKKSLFNDQLDLPQTPLQQILAATTLAFPPSPETDPTNLVGSHPQAKRLTRQQGTAQLHTHNHHPE